MKVNDYLNELRKIKDVAMATVDGDGYPQIRIIDVMAVVFFDCSGEKLLSRIT